MPERKKNINNEKDAQTRVWFMRLGNTFVSKIKLYSDRLLFLADLAVGGAAFFAWLD